MPPSIRVDGIQTKNCDTLNGKSIHSYFKNSIDAWFYYVVVTNQGGEETDVADIACLPHFVQDRHVQGISYVVSVF